MTSIHEQDLDPVEYAAAEWFACMQDELSAAEMHAAFEDWLAADPSHAQAYAKLMEMWQGMDALEPELQGHVRPQNKMHTQETIFQRTRYRWFAAAAVLLIYVTSAACLLTTPDMQAHYQTGDSSRNVTLRDGSELLLAPRSRLSINMDEQSRVAELHAGSAVFTVTADPRRPFNVFAGSGRVDVVGTIFQVTLAERVEVQVRRGAVDVISNNTGESLRLTRGYSVSYDDSGLLAAAAQPLIQGWEHLAGEISLNHSASVADELLAVMHMPNDLRLINSHPSDPWRSSMRQRRNRVQRMLAVERLTPVVV